MNEPRDRPRLAHRFRWAIPGLGSPIDDAWAVFEHDKLVELQAYRNQHVDRAWDDAVLVPRASNAHCHLELSELTSLRPQNRPTFTAWLAKVIQFRQQNRNADPRDTAARLVAGWQEGAGALVKSRTDWVGDILSPELLTMIEPPASLRGTLFVEFLGWTRSRVVDASRRLAHTLDAEPSLPSSWTIGLSPHASYTVAPHFLEHLCRTAAHRQWPVAMHLAESAEEMELLINQSGPLVELLRAVGAWEPGIIAGRFPPLEYLHLLQAASRSLVIHGNYLEPPEWEFLACHRDRMAVVYCPRTHAAFDHRPYPLAGMLRAGVRVVLGTDSLATAPSLNIWEEVSACVHRHPEIAPRKAVQMVTTDVWDWRGETHRKTPFPRLAAEWTAFRLEKTSDPYSFLTCDAPRAYQIGLASTNAR